MNQTNSMSQKVSNRTLSLIRVLSRNTSESKKILSYLRKTDGVLVNSPNVWGFIYRGESSEEPELSEQGYQAVLTSLKFFAIHVYLTPEANRSSKEGALSVGEYLAEFRKTSAGSNIDSKVSAILLAQNFERRIRLLETLFKRSTKEIRKSIDYEKFSKQVFLLQNSEFQKSIIADWGKKYYQSSSPNKNNSVDKD